MTRKTDVVMAQRYDGVVGDVTITANRSEYAGFTFPYTSSGVSMLVPVRDVRSHRAWIFLKPLTADLWLVSATFFILTGIVVWFLEHRLNPDFRGPPAHQLGTVFYFSFSTLVFAHSKHSLINSPFSKSHLPAIFFLNNCLYFLGSLQRRP